MCLKIAQLAVQTTRILPVLLVPPKILPLAGLIIDRFQLAFLRFFFEIFRNLWKRTPKWRTQVRIGKLGFRIQKRFLSNHQNFLFFIDGKRSRTLLTSFSTFQTSQFLPIRNLCFSFEIFVETNSNIRRWCKDY
jgi:hypothetical protein